METTVLFLWSVIDDLIRLINVLHLPSAGSPCVDGGWNEAVQSFRAL
jgi:hypothetical protein